MLKKALAAAAVAAGIVSGAPSADAARYWTPWVSEENGGPWTECTSWNEGAVGFGCSGDYCDDVRLLCETFNDGMTLDPSTLRYSHWFSEEYEPGGGVRYPNAGNCQDVAGFQNGLVSGVHCRGDYCDDLQVECAALVKYSGSTAIPAHFYVCYWVGPISEENGSQDFGANRYITQVLCHGDYCDDKDFEVCTFRAPF